MNKTITLPVVNPFTIGELLYFFEIQTAYAGELLNINAFDQPGVEEGKKPLCPCSASMVTTKNAANWTAQSQKRQNIYSDRQYMNMWPLCKMS
ncbi:MAG: hypothetical protein V8Q85_04575 [Christensenellales bacterium]